MSSGRRLACLIREAFVLSVLLLLSPPYLTLLVQLGIYVLGSFERSSLFSCAKVCERVGRTKRCDRPMQSRFLGNQVWMLSAPRVTDGTNCRVER